MDTRLIIEIYIGVGLLMSDHDDLEFSLRSIVGTLVGVLLYPLGTVLDYSWNFIRWFCRYFNFWFFWQFFFTKEYSKPNREAYDYWKNEKVNNYKFIEKWIILFGLWLIKKRHKY